MAKKRQPRGNRKRSDTTFKFRCWEADVKSISYAIAVRGEVHPPHDVASLTQDMLEVELPGDVFIDVGWYPEHDPAGGYVIMAFCGDPDTLLYPEYHTKDPLDAARCVQAWAAERMLFHLRRIAKEKRD